MTFSYAMGRASLQFVKNHPATFFRRFPSRLERRHAAAPFRIVQSADYLRLGCSCAVTVIVLLCKKHNPTRLLRPDGVSSVTLAGAGAVDDAPDDARLYVEGAGRGSIRSST